MKTQILLLFFIVSCVRAQGLEFNVSVSNDTLLLGNYLEVKFEIKNGNGSFEPPEFSAWTIVGGPNTASSYSMVNGEVNQSITYTYYLEAPADGIYEINVAKLKSEEKEYKTPALKIVVLQNPEGIRQHPKYKSEGKFFQENQMPSTSDKKKRKVTKL